ncbi:MAG: hypothetical protein DI539_12920 [Flavobacterium psychrophilum]|nr:MAG: hypothetical protein DI539_12920 [Flavobacterium psychrophilum]
MKKITFKASMLVIAGMLALTANAQQKQNGVKKFGRPAVETQPCGTVEYEKLLQKKNPGLDTKDEFEQWIAPKVAEVKRKRIQKNGNNTNEVVTIPVVFHIIHNGSPVGVDENIADGQVLSQIEVLNEDFRRLSGSNGYNTNPVGADMEINFCLAKQDPDGLLSTGIIRYNLGSGDGWSMEQAEVIKAQTQWDPNKYLNIWVFDELYGLAGYAQFPTNSGLEGIDIDGLPTAANTDGVALGHRYVGSEEKFPAGEYDDARNLGRSATHEIGHFFGLRHIWGDSDSCATATDYCDDTPTALSANYGCQVGLDSCPDNPGDDMIENYMDYSDDACVNVFTQDQKDRMQAVLLNSPRRHSLITSTGCVPGIVLENDGSLEIHNGSDSECGTSTFAPELVLTNSGSANLTTATIVYSIDNEDPVTYEWSGNLAANASATITIPEAELTVGEHTFSADITTVNGVEDTAPSNDNKSINFTIAGLYTTSSIKITIVTDDYGDETLWGLAREGNQDEIIAGNININNIWQSDWYESNETYITNVPVTVDDCYAFVIIDLSGDGICCEYGNGSYKIETLEGVIIAEGGSFADQDQRTFSLKSPTAGLDDVKKANGIKLYPNPANNTLNIAVADEASTPEKYSIYNTLGQVMDSGTITSALQSVDVSKYANGVYFVKLAKGQDTTTLQFIKQ